MSAEHTNLIFFYRSYFLSVNEVSFYEFKTKNTFLSTCLKSSAIGLPINVGYL